MIHTDFSAGELSPKFKGRPDLEIYRKGCLHMSNVIPFFPGGFSIRGGFEYLNTIGSSKVRLIPFIISEALAYILEFSSGKIRIWKNGELLTSGGIPLEITTAYSDPFDLQTAQDSEKLFIASHLAPVKVLALTAIDTFSFSTLSIVGVTSLPIVGDVVIGSTTVSNIESTSGLSVGQGISGQGLDSGTSIASVGATSITVSKPAIASFAGARLYYAVPLPFQSSGNYPRAIAIHDGRLILASTENEPQTLWASAPFDYGNFVTYTHIVSESKQLREPMRAFFGTITTGSPVVTGIDATDVEKMKVGDTVFGPGIPYDYPDTVTRIQSIASSSITLDASATATGTVTLFDAWYDRSFPEYETVESIRDIITAGNAYKKPIASDINEAILWLASANDLIIGTTTGERVIPSGSNATTLVCKKATAHGSARIQPLLLNSSIVFVGPDKRVLREYVYRGISSESQLYAADRLDKGAAHILSGITQIDYSSSKHSILWAVQATGELVGCLLDPSLSPPPFFRIQVDDASIESVCVIPENGEDVLYASVNRLGIRSLEKLHEPESGFYLDDAKLLTVAGGSLPCDWISGNALLSHNAALYSVPVVSGSVSVPAGIALGAQVVLGRRLVARVKTLPAVENPLRKKTIPQALIRVVDSSPFKIGYEGSLATTNHGNSYSGDVTVHVGGGWDSEGIITIEQESLPLTILALELDVKAGG